MCRDAWVQKKLEKGDGRARGREDGVLNASRETTYNNEKMHTYGAKGRSKATVPLTARSMCENAECILAEQNAALGRPSRTAASR